MNQRSLAQFKGKVEKLLDQVQQAESGVVATGFDGEAEGDTLEHNVRKGFLNNLLADLGWKLDAAVVEEARVRADTTLFIDYLGVHLDHRVPVLILEAKSWESPLIAPSRSGGRGATPDNLSHLVARSLDYIKGGKQGPPPAINDWIEWLSQLRGYVLGLKEQSGHLVTRVAICSGQWIVIFTNPGAAFVADDAVSHRTILVLAADKFVSESDQIYGHLSYEQLASNVPSPLRPTQLKAFIDAQAVRRLFRALWIKWEESGSDQFGTFPKILLYPMVVIERLDGVLLEIGKPTDPLLVPSDLPALGDHLRQVSSQSDALLQEVFQELGARIEPSKSSTFTGFRALSLRGDIGGLPPALDAGVKHLIRSRRDRRDEFLLVTGEAPHFMLEMPTVSQCMGHDWGACKKAGVQVGQQPITHANAALRAYFGSGASHHCSHVAIHDKRSSHCHLGSFETFYCCHTCLFRSSCWSEEKTPLPCGST